MALFAADTDAPADTAIAPCTRCLCPIFWRDLAGTLHCAECVTTPEFIRAKGWVYIVRDNPSTGKAELRQLRQVMDERPAKWEQGGNPEDVRDGSSAAGANARGLCKPTDAPAVIAYDHFPAEHDQRMDYWIAQINPEDIDGTSPGVRKEHWHPVLDDAGKLMSPGSRGYRLQPGPCAFCGGRTVHSEMCCTVQAGWSRMPWGKHAGKLMREIPEEYLQWVRGAVSRGEKSLDDELMEEIREVLNEIRE